MRLHTSLGTVLFGTLTVCSLLSLACGEGTRDVGDPDGWTRGSVGPDASTSDATPEGVASEADYDLVGGRESCLDFTDNDGNGVADCDDPACVHPAVNAACCVGSTARVCCDADTETTVTASLSPVPTLSFEGVALSAVRGTVYAGEGLPQTCEVPVEAAFAPIGTDTTYGLLAVPRTVAPQIHHLEVRARIGVDVPVDGHVAAAGFGLFTEQGLGALARPLLAVVASATTNDVRVIMGDRVIASAPLPEGPCGRSHEHVLELTPEGAFRIRRRAPGTDTWDPDFDVRGAYDVSADARVAIFGQQRNPEALPEAWVSNLTVTRHGCDRLAPHRQSTPVVAATDGQDVTGFAVFPRDDEATQHEALVVSGQQLHWMSVQSARGGLVSRAPANPFADNIQPTWPGIQRLRDVTVVLHGGVHRVFLAVSDDAAGETFRIVETTYSPGATASVPGTLGATVTDLLTATAFAGGVSVDGPTARFVSAIGQLVLVVRVRYADGHTELRVAPSLASSDFEAAPSTSGRDAAGVTTDGLVRANAAQSAEAFDRDEVATPQLVELEGVVRVLYAGRRGTRWSLGSIVASPGFTHFLPVGAEPSLAPSGAGFDALGVSTPQFVRRGDTDWLYYAGSDGARRGIGLATQPALRR